MAPNSHQLGPIQLCQLYWTPRLTNQRSSDHTLLKDHLLLWFLVHVILLCLWGTEYKLVQPLLGAVSIKTKNVHTL